MLINSDKYNVTIRLKPVYIRSDIMATTRCPQQIQMFNIENNNRIQVQQPEYR